MSNAIYPKFKQGALQALSNLGTAAVKCLLVTSGYAYSATHANLSDIPAGNRVATSPALTTKTFGTDGSFHSDNVTFAAVTGSAANAVVFFIDSGTESTSTLIAYQDTGIAGLPITPSGADIQLVEDAVNGWFKL